MHAYELTKHIEDLQKQLKDLGKRVAKLESARAEPKGKR